jgi:hypothetical protein|tara:strand:- start:102 stop:323 length:222 start_codon:yes stop_codon:yes gene_type:complete
MEPKGYELLKIETKISALEKELTVLFEDLRKYETDDDSMSENPTYKKLQKMNVCCLKLLETYREYANNLKNNT